MRDVDRAKSARSRDHIVQLRNRLDAGLHRLVPRVQGAVARRISNECRNDLQTVLGAVRQLGRQTFSLPIGGNVRRTERPQALDEWFMQGRTQPAYPNTLSSEPWRVPAYYSERVREEMRARSAWF